MVVSRIFFRFYHPQKIPHTNLRAPPANNSACQNAQKSSKPCPESQYEGFKSGMILDVKGMSPAYLSRVFRRTVPKPEDERTGGAVFAVALKNRCCASMGWLKRIIDTIAPCAHNGVLHPVLFAVVPVTGAGPAETEYSGNTEVCCRTCPSSCRLAGPDRAAGAAQPVTRRDLAASRRVCPMIASSVSFIVARNVQHSE